MYLPSNSLQNITGKVREMIVKCFYILGEKIKSLCVTAMGNQNIPYHSATSSLDISPLSKLKMGEK